MTCTFVRVMYAWCACGGANWPLCTVTVKRASLSPAGCDCLMMLPNDVLKSHQTGTNCAADPRANNQLIVFGIACSRLMFCTNTYHLRAATRWSALWLVCFWLSEETTEPLCLMCLEFRWIHSQTPEVKQSTAGNVSPLHVIIPHLRAEVGVRVGITFMQLETGLLNFWDQTEVPSCCRCIIKGKWGLFTARNIYLQDQFANIEGAAAHPLISTLVKQCPIIFKNKWLHKQKKIACFDPFIFITEKKNCSWLKMSAGLTPNWWRFERRTRLLGSSWLMWMRAR